MVRANQIQNYPITSKDITNTKVIFGTHLSGLMGNTVIRTPKRVYSGCVEIPRQFQLFQKSITLVTNILFVNEIPFFITLSGKICFVVVKHMFSRTSNQLSRYLNKTCILYAHASYNVEVILMDIQFGPVASKISHVAVNTAVAREHVGYIKIQIRVVKEHLRATLNTLPFRAVHKRFIVELVYFTALWINYFPENTVIYKVYSPREIISEQKLDFKLHYII